jgi:hypothetical protein
VEDERRTFAEWEELYRRRRMSERPGRDLGHGVRCCRDIGHRDRCCRGWSVTDCPLSHALN